MSSEGMGSCSERLEEYAALAVYWRLGRRRRHVVVNERGPKRDIAGIRQWGKEGGSHPAGLFSEIKF